MPDQARSPPTPPFQSLSGTGCPISLIGHGRARSRMVLGAISKYAPTPEAAEFLRQLNTSKEEFHSVVTDDCLKLGELLQLAAGNDIISEPNAENTTTWAISFGMIVSAIPRLQPHLLLHLMRLDFEQGDSLGLFAW
ncbi:hypothetical protein PENSPDRAFT_686920 [Peniophora sp. CONT]|nr:hypothetical protein PENSPDRAFT_686920 [Peniophora sp. CONT]